MLTMCIKVTFSLLNGQTSVLAPQQQALHADIPWDDAPGSSLYAPSDFVPTKPRVDVLLSGHVYAPGGKPAHQLVARVTVDEFSKSLLVRGKQRWINANDALVPGPAQPFMRIPLRYDQADLREGDPGFTAAASPVLGAALPHFDKVPGSPNVDSPVGFSPVAPRVRALRTERGQDVMRWAESLNAHGRAAPPNQVDWTFFNSAPRDQQIATLRAAPRITLENLNPSIPHVETRLPATAPRAFHLDPGTDQVTEVRLRCDTLRIDTDRGNALLTYRGTLALSRMAERAPGVLGVMLEEAGAAPGMDDLLRRMRARAAIVQGMSSAPIELIEVEPEDSEVEPATVLGGSPSPAALPFASGTPGVSPLIGAGSLASSPATVKLAEPQQAAPALKGGMAEAGHTTLPRAYPSVSRTLPSAADDGDEAGSSPLLITSPAAAPVLPFATGDGATYVDRAPPPRASPLATQAFPSPAHDDSNEAGALTEPRAGPSPTATMPFLSDHAQPNPDVPPAFIKPPATAEMAGREGTAKAKEKGEEEPGSPQRDTAPAAPAKKKPGPEAWTLEKCAALTVTIARRKGEKEKVLEAAGLTAEEWGAIEKDWLEAIQAEMRRGKRAMLDRFDIAYMEQLEKERGTVGVEEYAKLMRAAEMGTTGDIAAELSIPQGAIIRIQRIWAKRLTTEIELNDKLMRHMAHAR
jgi:hypothetical protein